MKKYSRIKWSRIFRDTCVWIKEDQKGWIYLIVSSVLGFAFRWIEGAEMFASKFLESALYSLVAPAIVLLIIFIVNILKTPAKIYYEQENKINDLEVKVNSIENKNELEIRYFHFEIRKHNSKDFLFLWIENYGLKKLIEMEAKIQVVHMFTECKVGGNSQTYKRLMPYDGVNILDKQEIKSKGYLEVGIALCSDDFSSVNFRDPKLEFGNFEEAIFWVFVEFIGKSDDESIYKNKLIRTDLYINKSKKYFSLASLAKGLNVFSPTFEKNVINSLTGTKSGTIRP